LALCIFAVIFQQQIALAAEETTSDIRPTLNETVIGDYKSFYAGERLLRMGLVFGAASIAVNTNLDMSMRNWYQNSVRNDDTNSWSSSSEPAFSFRAKSLGEVKYLLPVSLLAASVNFVDNDTAIGNWGANTSRAYLVGVPAMWGMQQLTGASRPDETTDGPAWHPFKDDNGVSGHAFFGAIPFITIAYMNPDNALTKYSAYVASTAAAWSRANDDKHFPLQILLGWYIAWESVDAVFENNAKQKKKFSITPMAGADGVGLMLRSNW
jgi:PAP2 superfamily